MISDYAKAMLKQGREICRFHTFGNEAKRTVRGGWRTSEHSRAETLTSKDFRRINIGRATRLEDEL
jgi:hypothetical protein